ncbi:MAG: peptidoglycan editing factor PgeF, partial [Burkholderiales bacterium]|nr:peptidoglycan editing factor PgeF [Burkholderiales bacterium]
GGGASRAPWDAFNLGLAVGDEPDAVAANRAAWAAALGARPVWLRQVHGTRVLCLDEATPDAPDEPADAAWSRARGVACTVQVADCLPVLFALRDGSAVAAAHAGWRGLAGGVLEATVAALCGGMGARAADLLAWLGPCIGPRAFEVGADVLQAFGVDARTGDDARFVARPRPDGSLRWRAHLQRLARDRLEAAGLVDISADDSCTVEDASRFFSFRRDGVTGRMAAAVWRL